MRTHSLLGGSLAAITMAVLLAACDDPESRNPLTPRVPTVAGLEMIGPDTLAPGQSAQYTATTRLSDGTRKTDASANIQWTADAQFLRVDSSGLVTAQQQLGDTTLRAAVQGRPTFSTRQITIVPAGTFRVTGRVIDAEFPSTFVPNARVEATPGSVVTTSDASGNYRLYGVPPEATIRVTREGYRDVEQQLQLSAHATQDFRMSQTGERLTLNGNYTLAIEVGGACTGNFSLQPALRSRRYEAAVTQNGNTVDVLLTEARFRLNSIGRGNRFTGQVTGSRVTFTLEFYFSYYYPYYAPYGFPNVAEELSDRNVLVPEGSVVAIGSSSRVSGLMSNFSRVEHWDSRFPNGGFLGSCSHTAPILFTLEAR